MRLLVQRDEKNHVKLGTFYVDVQVCFLKFHHYTFRATEQVNRGNYQMRNEK